MSRFTWSASRTPRAWIAVAAFLASVVPGPFVNRVDAQYFGQNKVQYETFDFRVLPTDHFDIYYYPEEEQAARLAAAMAERWYARLSQLLQHELRGRQPIILYASPAHFQQTNAIVGLPGEGTGGVTEAIKRRIVLPLAGPLAETDHVLGHELVHAFQFDITGQGKSGDPGALQLPLWFIEGMAEYLSLGPVDPHTAMWMRDAARREKLPTLDQLADPKFFPYRYGHAFWAYIAGHEDDRIVGDILKVAGQRGNPLDAIREVLHVEPDDLSRAWHEAIRATYRPLAEAKRMPSYYGRSLSTEERGGGKLNVGPALSPDGRRIVFLSERDLFSIDLFLAEAETGRIIRKIVTTATDPHLDSLQFINSAGSWQADGRRFVFSALAKGQPMLSLLDVDRGETIREIVLPELGEIFNPAWSPDGRYIAFSASRGGLTDLYLYDLQTDRLRGLTDDPFADLDPAWSPDGRRIAFVTDRFSSSLSALQFGAYRLALIDPESGRIESLPGFDGAKNINPRWAADGTSVYFVSDRDGIANVYRLDVATGDLFQVTDLLGGVSGITALSPSLSVAAASDRLVFSVHEDDSYRLYAIDSRERLAGGALASRVGTVDAAALPPAERGTSQVQALLSDASVGRIDPQQIAERPYRPGLALDYVGQPTLMVGTDRFGPFVGGGLSMFFSDMLGDHSIGTVVQATSNIKELGGLIGYQNVKSRWNWSVVGEWLPLMTGGSFSQSLGRVGNEPALIEQERISLQIDRGLSAFVAYPFNRAQRIEFAGGFRNIGFDDELRTRAFSTRTGNLILDERTELPSPGSLKLFESSAALVYDTSVFGATSPILGQRYRVELSQTGGELGFSGVLVDYRRYFMPARPYTLAGRVLHFGRYGGDAEDGRLFPLYLGYPNLVRGYDLGSFEARECVPTAESDCPAFDRLLGSRVLVTNLELRFPPVGAFGGSSYYGPVPVELALFTDAGIAWTKETKASFLGGTREWVTSVGLAIRALLGFAIVEIDYVRPLSRPGRGWTWQFNFSPGF